MTNQVKRVDMLSLSPEKTHAHHDHPDQGSGEPMMALAAIAMGGDMARTPTAKLRDRLIEKDFDAFITHGGRCRRSQRRALLPR